MARQAVTDALATKRKNRPIIGYLLTASVCPRCVPLPRKHVVLEELREGDDAGNPYVCHKCGGTLEPDDTTQIGS